MVGTTYIESGCQVSISASVVSASNLPPSTTWLPASSAVIVHMNGPLWYSGPGIKCVPLSCIINSGGTSGSIVPGWLASMSLGRPVDPPEVMAFHGFEIASGTGPSSNLSTAIGSRTTTRGSASSMIASSSRCGRRAETGCGVAPILRHATTVATNSTELPSAIVTRSPATTP